MSLKSSPGASPDSWPLKASNGQALVGSAPKTADETSDGGTGSEMASKYNIKTKSPEVNDCYGVDRFRSSGRSTGLDAELISL